MACGACLSGHNMGCCDVGGPMPGLPFNPLSLLNVFPAGAAFTSAAVPVVNMAQSMLPPSAEDEQRFAALVARWAAIEGNFGDASLKKDASFKAIAQAYKEWTAARDAWLSGKRDVRALGHLESITSAAEQFFNARSALPSAASVLGPKDSGDSGVGLGTAAVVALVGAGAAGIVYLLVRK